MSVVSLENMSVFKLNGDYLPSTLQKKFALENSSMRNEYNTNVAEKHRVKASLMDMSSLDEPFDFSVEDLANYKAKIDEDQQKVIAEAAKNKYEAELLNKYETSFSYLYQIKKQNEEFGDNFNMHFKEITQNQPIGIMTQEQYFEMSANPKGETKQLALQVDLPNNNSFDLIMPPYDKPGSDMKEVKAQIAFSEEAIEKMNEKKLTEILEFCNQHGLSTFQMDLPYSFDGNLDIDEKFKNMFAQLKANSVENENKNAMLEFDENIRQKMALQKEADGQVDAMNDVSFDMPRSNEIVEQENVVLNAESVDNSAKPNTSSQKDQPIPTVSQASKEKPKKLADAETALESLLEDGMKKVRGYHYFKEHSGIFHTGWTEYIVYDKGDIENRKKDAKRDSKSGDVKYTYAFKIFVRQDKGKFRFAYRAPYGKKVDDSVINGMIGKMKGLGITHVRFPDGLPDNEKKLWRTSLAENGMIPVGMGLDRVKAEGMLKAAKEKLTAEDYKKYRYKLIMQMEKENKTKGKELPPSEQEFIDSIKNSQKYMSFTGAYNDRLKGLLRDKLDEADINHNDGAIDKAGAYVAMRRLFDVYREVVDDNTIDNSTILTAEEKNKLKAAGIVGPVSELNTDQMVDFYNILFVRAKQDAKDEIDSAMMDAHDVGNRTSKGPKRADNVIIKEVFDGSRNRFEKINEILPSLGVEEISFPKAFGRLHYDNFYVEHPEFIRKQPAKAQENAVSKPIENNNSGLSNVYNRVKNGGRS